jgi:hypothetical protein
MRSGITLPFYVLLLCCVLESDSRSTISDVQKSHIRNVGRCCFRSSAMLNTLIFGSREACSANKPRCMACDDVASYKEAWSIWGIVVDHNPKVRYQTHLRTCIARIGIVRDLRSTMPDS